MAFCTGCGQQTEGGRRTAGEAELCLFCGAGPEVHHGYPGRRSSRHASPGDAYANQDGVVTARSACRVPLSDYPSLTDLPAIADTWPTASYSSRSRTGRHALPPEPAVLRPRVTAQLTLRPGPPEFGDEQLAGGPFALPSGLPEPRPPQLPGPEQQGPEWQDPNDRPGPDDAGDTGSRAPARPEDHRVLPVRAAAHRALTAARGSRWVNTVAAGLVVVVGAATAAIALADHDPPAPSRNAAGDLPLQAAGSGGQNSSAGADGSGAGPIDLVHPAATASGAPHERQVLSLLERYFGAINAHDFPAYQKLFRPGLRSALSAAAFGSEYGSATDSDAILRGITPISSVRFAALVTFINHQQPGSGSASTSCTDWSVRLYLLREDGRYVLAKPPASYRPSTRSCG